MPSGDFSCADLLKVQVAVDRIWADNQMAQDYIPQVGVLTAIRTEQTVTLVEIEDPMKDKTLKIYWAADCDDADPEDCDDDCIVGGDEAEAQCKEYALDICKRKGFTVPDKRFRTSQLSKEEVVAKLLAKKMKILEEYLARTTVAKLNSFAGVNQYNEGEGVVTGSGDTYIAASYWNEDLYGYFAQVIIMNKFNNAFMIHGRNLHRMSWLAQYNNLNDNQKDQLAKLNSIRSYWDMFNVDGVNSPDKISYMITKGAVAFANKAYYPTTPVTYVGAGLTQYSIESKALPGVMFDVVYTTTCVNNQLKHHWTIYVHAGIFLNPFGCNEDITGVLRFICGPVPAGS